MTKKACILACCLLFLSISAFAQSPHQPPLSKSVLAAILGRPASAGACAKPQSKVLFAANRPSGHADCTASANCDTGTVSCTGSNNCTAVDRDCSVGEPGHVTCDGNTTACPTACPDECSVGTPRQRACCRCDATGDCGDCCVCAYGFEVPDCCG